MVGAAKIVIKVLLGVLIFFALVSFVYLFLHDIVGVKVDNQKIAALLCVPLGVLVAGINYFRLTNNLIARTVSTYILMAISFTGLYYLSYSRNPNYYSFSSGILMETERLKMENLTDDIRLGYRKHGFLSSLRLWVESTLHAKSLKTGIHGANVISARQIHKKSVYRTKQAELKSTSKTHFKPSLCH